MSLEAAYRRGALTEAQANRYEDMIHNLWVLEREVASS